MGIYQRPLQSDELYHFGIKGQKWGKRRFQNKDGSLTPEGYIHYGYGKHTGSGMSRTKNNHAVMKAKYDLKKVSDTTDVLKKGSTVLRYTEGQENLDGKRKYVSFTDADVDNYGYNTFDNGDKYFVERYELLDDVKIANGREVTNYILSKYGNKKMTDVYATNRRELSGNMLLKGIEGKMMYSPHSLREVDYLDNSRKEKKYNKQKQKIEKLMRTALNKNMSDILEHFDKEGYDAIADAEDIIADYSEYPIILIKPDAEKYKKIYSENLWKATGY